MMPRYDSSPVFKHLDRLVHYSFLIQLLSVKRYPLHLSDPQLLSVTSWGGAEEREVLSSSPWYPVIGCLGMAQSCIRGGLNWVLRSISLLSGWSNTGTGFLKRWSMLQASQCLRGIWTMPLTTHFSLVSPEVVRQLDHMIIVAPVQLK